MTHLRIEQNNIQENVSSAVIEKLYQLAISGDLDASSRLAGNLYVPATYQEYINVLTDQTDPKFRDLTITAGNIYIMFADSEVQRVLLANNIGDGVGITVAQAAATTYAQVGSIFKNNTTIMQFDELRFFTNLTQCPSFNGCENLQHIQLPSSVTNMGRDSISSCTSLVSLGDTSHLITFNPNQSSYYQALILDFDNLDSLTGNFSCKYGIVTPNSDVVLSSPGLTAINFDGMAAKTLTITAPITSLACVNCPNLQQVVLPHTCTQLDGKGFKGCTNLTTVNLQYVQKINSEGFQNVPVTDLNLSSITHLGSGCFAGINNVNITLPSNNWEYWSQPQWSNNAFTRCTFSSITNLEVLSNYDYINRDFPFFGDNSPILDIVNFAKATSYAPYQVNTGRKEFCEGFAYKDDTKYVRQLYAPKLTSTIDFGFGVSPFAALNGSPNKRFTCKLIYFRDITSLAQFTFCGLNCEALVINNTTPPTAPITYYTDYNEFSNNHVYGANIDCFGNFTDAQNQSQAFGYNSTNATWITPWYSQNKLAVYVNITAIYVPDSAVNTYKAASGWTSVASIIHPISDLNGGTKYATKALWEAAGKPVALIEEYM